MTLGYDAIVVGGGAMGATSAWWLARRGRRVLLLEQFEPGHRRGSSHGASRIFRLAYPEPDYVRLAQEALPLWRQLEAEAGTPLLTTTGSVDHGDDEELTGVARALDECGAAVEMLSGEEASGRWPGMRFDGEVLHQPDGGRVNADATVHALHRVAAERGADLRFDEPVIVIDVEGDGVRVTTARGHYSAASAVVAPGAWADRLLGGLVELPPVAVTQEQVFHFPPADHDLAWPSFIHHRRPYVYGLETPGEGVKVAEDHTGPLVDPDRRSFAVDPAGAERVAGYVREWLPGLRPGPSSAVTCLYATTPTHDFVIDRAGPLVVACGFSGHGFKFTPLVGRLVADLVDGAPPHPRLALR